MDVQHVLAAYIQIVSTEELLERRESVEQHLRRVEDVALQRDFVDLALAREVGRVLGALLDDSDQYTARERALLAGAVRYFTDHDDVDGDLTSPTGFEDDAAILNAVCVFLGRPELSIAVD